MDPNNNPYHDPSLQQTSIPFTNPLPVAQWTFVQENYSPVIQQPRPPLHDLHQPFAQAYQPQVTSSSPPGEPTIPKKKGKKPKVRVPVHAPEEITTISEPASGRRVVHTAKQLLDIVQAAVAVRLFEATHGDKLDVEKEMATILYASGVGGSIAVFKTRLADLLYWHQASPKANKTIVSTVEGSSVEPLFGAPLDILAEQQRVNANKSDTDKQKAEKKAKEDREGGFDIRHASLVRSRKTNPTPDIDNHIDNDATEAGTTSVDTISPSRCGTPPRPSTFDEPETPLLPCYSPPPISPLGNDHFGSIGSAAEGHGCSPSPCSTSGSVIDLTASDEEGYLPSLPTVKTETPDGLIEPGTGAFSGGSSRATSCKPAPAPLAKKSRTSKKRSSADGSDDENTPPATARSTKRVRSRKSQDIFDIKDFLERDQAERKIRDERVIAQIKRGNDHAVESMRATKEFQDGFLGLLRQLVPAPAGDN